HPSGSPITPINTATIISLVPRRMFISFGSTTAIIPGRNRTRLRGLDAPRPHSDHPPSAKNSIMSTSASSNILNAIGNTSLVQLPTVAPSGCARILVKLEWENPTGSMKDRAAHAMISRAEADGRLNPGDTIIEYTGGSTGT